MTATEAEAAIGRRGDVLVTAENRGLVRKWFAAQNLPALFVGGLWVGGSSPPGPTSNINKLSAFSGRQSAV
jgi:hypothetical protein